MTRTRFYIFNEKENSCVVFSDESKFIKEKNKETLICSEGILPLSLISKNAFQWQYKHQDAILIIEKHGDKVISATLKNVSKEQGKSLGTIFNYNEKDWGQAVWYPRKQGYILKKDLPKIFRIFKTDYDPKQPWNFFFNHDWHLILKDKDKQKPHYWYYWDYTPELAEFVYETLSPYIKPEKGEIVAIPGELGEACFPWGFDFKYATNYSYCSHEPESVGYDFSQETTQKWINKNLPPALVITFLPTYFNNHNLPNDLQLNGTKWFKKIWEVFGARGVPVVVKAYPGWVYENLYKFYQPLYDQISSITELPPSIDNREVGKANLLVYFNCPWLGKSVADKTKYI